MVGKIPDISDDFNNMPVATVYAAFDGSCVWGI